jgi:hypothetical protein
MIDRTTPLLVRGRIADRQAEARARRLAAELKGAEEEGERAFWLTDGIAALRASGGSVLRRVRRREFRAGSVAAPARNRA